MENFFCCKNCDKLFYSTDCVLYDIVDTVSGRTYYFRCPSCELVQNGEIITEYNMGDIEYAIAIAGKKRGSSQLHEKMHDVFSR